MGINFLKYRKIYFVFSGILILLTLVSIFSFGFNFGNDFKGGSILEVKYKNIRPSNQEIEEKLADLKLGKIIIQPSENLGVVIRMKDISEETHQEVLKRLRSDSELEEIRFESIGPVIGRELVQKTKILIFLSLLVILIYVALAFGRISGPMKSWEYALVTALVALFHDILIPLGFFVVLGKFYDIQITLPIIAALLTVFGYSINDTIVIFDRIRENLLKREGFTFEEVVNKSLNQVLIRSINISLTTIIVLVAIYFFGGSTLKDFSLALIIGIVTGTYSSIFIAAPLMVSWAGWKEKRKRKF
jgi:preprotein translocase subunit SecF